MMKSIRWRPVVAVLILGYVAEPALAATMRVSAPTTEQTARLEEHRTRIERGMTRGEANEWMAALAEEVRLMPEYHGTIFGRAGAERYFAAFFERFRVVRHERRSMTVWNLGERLVECGRFEQVLARKDDGRERVLDGKYLEIWSRTDAAGWQVSTTIWNYSRWPEFADELRFPEVPGVRTAMEARVPVRGGVSFELAALNKLQEVAIAEKDHAIWSQFYADDAVLLPNHAPAAEGRGAIDGYIQAHVKGMPVYEKLDIRNDRIDDLGDWVIDYASHVANWRNGDASGVNTGKNVRVWRREPRGGLKMVCQIGTYD
jgi:hypothetical protein